MNTNLNITAQSSGTHSAPFVTPAQAVIHAPFSKEQRRVFFSNVMNPSKFEAKALGRELDAEDTDTDSTSQLTKKELQTENAGFEDGKGKVTKLTETITTWSNRINTEEGRIQKHFGFLEKHIPPQVAKEITELRSEVEAMKGSSHGLTTVAAVLERLNTHITEIEKSVNDTDTIQEIFGVTLDQIYSNGNLNMEEYQKFLSQLTQVLQTTHPLIAQLQIKNIKKEESISSEQAIAKGVLLKEIFKLSPTQIFQSSLLNEKKINPEALKPEALLGLGENADIQNNLKILSAREKQFQIDDKIGGKITGGTLGTIGGFLGVDMKNPESKQKFVDTIKNLIGQGGPIGIIVKFFVFGMGGLGQNVDALSGLKKEYKAKINETKPKNTKGEYEIQPKNSFNSILNTLGITTSPQNQLHTKLQSAQKSEKNMLKFVATLKNTTSFSEIQLIDYERSNYAYNAKEKSNGKMTFAFKTPEAAFIFAEAVSTTEVIPKSMLSKLSPSKIQNLEAKSSPIPENGLPPHRFAIQSGKQVEVALSNTSGMEQMIAQISGKVSELKGQIPFPKKDK